jgi:hypothetical protein
MIARGFMHLKVLPCRAFFFFALVHGIVLCSKSSALAQSSIAPFSGEALHYEVTYEWGPIYLEVGEVIFSASDGNKSNLRPSNTIEEEEEEEEQEGNQHVWDFEGWGTSKPNWDWFYPVNSTYSSQTDASFLPEKFSRVGREGRHRYNRSYAREQENCMTISCLDGELDASSICTPDSSSEFRDVLSAIHWCRQLPWASYTRGDVIAMGLLLDGEVHRTTLEFIGNVKHHSEFWPDSIACWEFHPTLIDGTVFKPGDEMKVLMTADERRLPIYIETELIVGAAKIHLAQHNVHEITAFESLRDSCKRVTRNLD